MKEQLYQALSALLPTFQWEADEDNTEYPLAIYYVWNETYEDIWGDKQVGKIKNFTVKVYNKTDDDELLDTIEETIKGAFDFCYLDTKRNRKENGLFVCEFEFINHQ